ncbi:MAG: DedA family protein [Pseudoclavibacter caeni]|jgi:membrane protein DedA with SNARE-associated domain
MSVSAPLAPAAMPAGSAPSAVPAAAVLAGGDAGVIAAFVADVMAALGAPGVGLLIALENLFPPIPSEAILPLAGFAAARGELGLVAVIVWATVGSVAGALALYGLGAWLGHERLVRLADRIPLLSGQDVERTRRWFVRHGPATVLVGRLVPVFRSLISIPAGVERMRMAVFVPLTAVGSLVWNTALVLGGFLLGEHLDRIIAFVDAFQWVVLAVVGVAVAVFVVHRVHARRVPAEMGSDAGER